MGFTRLASDCSPKELVVMLNKLFGKFDQIAKVSAPACAASPLLMEKSGVLSHGTHRGILCPALCQGRRKEA